MGGSLSHPQKVSPRWCPLNPASSHRMTPFFRSGWRLHPRNIYFCKGTNLVLGPPKKFYCRNPSGTLRDVHWYHLGDPKKVPGAPSQGFLIFLGFDKNITKLEIWLSYPHFWANFQVSYHFGKVLTVRSQGFTASKNLSLHQ